MDDTVPPRGRTRPGTRSLLAQLGRGACMGAADVVPGVSGGTLALLLGIYDRLLAAISSGSHALGRFARGDVHGGLRRLREVDWWFLIPLLVGLVTTVVLLAGVIEGALIDYPEPMAGLFLGLVVASVVVTRREVAWSPQRLGGAALVGIAVFAGLGYQGAPITDPSAPVLLASGAVAVCAMVLPGISGSFLLLMLGMYSAVIGMVDERLVGDARLTLQALNGALEKSDLSRRAAARGALVQEVEAGRKAFWNSSLCWRAAPEGHSFGPLSMPFIFSRVASRSPTTSCATLTEASVSAFSISTWTSGTSPIHDSYSASITS